MTNRQGFFDHLFSVCQFTPDQQEELLKKLHDVLMSQFVARDILDQPTVEKLSEVFRSGTEQKSVNMDSLLRVFSEEQRQNADDIMNTVCETLEDTFLAHSTPEQKRQMLALLSH